MDVAHYFIEPAQVTSELQRIAKARDVVVNEIEQVKLKLTHAPATDAPSELTALLDVHLMLLQDETIAHGVREWIVERRYNAEWALTSQLEIISRQFDEMEDHVGLYGRRKCLSVGAGQAGRTSGAIQR
jgi:phosphotransferase system enzyme I (PtsI)